jgi:hypothetical protein
VWVLRGMLEALFGLAYLALTLFTGFWSVLTGLLGCYEECTDSGDWTDHRAAWQWNAITVLALVSVLTGLLMLAFSFKAPRVALALLGLQAAAAGAASAFLVHNYDASILWWYFAVMGSGLAFVWLRLAPTRADARGIPADPSA